MRKERMVKITAALLVVILFASVFYVQPISTQEQGTFLKIGMQDEPKNTNIYKATDVWTANVLGWFYPTLFILSPIDRELSPDFADSMEGSPDGLTYTIKLKQNAKWDDGTPINAQDVIFSFDLVKELQLPDYLPYIDGIVDSWSAPDDYTVVLKLPQCTPKFKNSTLIGMVIVPKHQWSKVLDDARKGAEPLQTFLDTNLGADTPYGKLVSGGPFSWGEWQKGSFVRIVANTNYYGKGRVWTTKSGKTLTEGPNYDGILFKIYGTTDAAILGLQKGEIDYIWWTIDPGFIANLLADPNVEVTKADELGYYYLAMNHAKEPFNDKAMRQALAMLVDKTFIASRVLQGYGGPAHSVVMPAAGKWYNDKVNKYGDGLAKADRIAKAKQILTAAGYSWDADGNLLLKNGKKMAPFDILTPPADYDPLRAMSGVLIQEWWRAIGVPATAKPTSFGQIVASTFEQMTFDVYILGWRIGGNPYPDHMYDFFHSSQAVPDGNNPMSFKNPEFDKLVEDLTKNCDENAQMADAFKAQEIAIDEVAYCPLYYRSLNEAHRKDTFEGWFVQLGGVAGSINYLTPLKPAGAKPTGIPVAVALVGLAGAAAYLVRKRKD